MTMEAQNEMTAKDLQEHYSNPETQRELDRIETEDARALLDELAANQAAPAIELLAIAKRWLKKHWSDGWQAAGGPAGLPERKRRRKKGA